MRNSSTSPSPRSASTRRACPPPRSPNCSPRRRRSKPPTLLTTDARFTQFIQAFGSLNTDNGAALQSANAVNAIVGAYQTNLFAQTVATNDPATTAADFTDGSTTVNKLLASFSASSGVSQPISDYQTRIGAVTSVADLVADPKVLKVALGAFNLDPATFSAGTVTDLLSGAPSPAATLLTLQNPDVAKFVAAFGSLNSDNGVQVNTAASIAAITTAYLANQFRQSIEAKSEAVVANPGLAATTPIRLGDSSSIAAITSAFQANQFRQSLVSTVQSLPATPALGSIS